MRLFPRFLLSSLRDADQPHRASTVLELFFDLVVVIAIAAAAANLHHAIEGDEAAIGALKFAAMFWAIWWAWVNFTWYATALDSDDAIHRVLTMVLMFGGLIFSAGIGGFFHDLTLDFVLAGYLTMRGALALMWLRHGLASAGPAARRARVQALALIGFQGLWILAFGFVPTPALFWVLGGLAVLETLSPLFINRVSALPWHLEHIVERHGLLTIIVLGEGLLAVSLALSGAWQGGLAPVEPGALDAHGHGAAPAFAWGLLMAGATAMVIVGALWWWYFDLDHEAPLGRKGKGTIWSYGHALIFAGGAATGAGLAAWVEFIGGLGHEAAWVAQMAVNGSVAVFLAGLWLVHEERLHPGWHRVLLPTTCGGLIAVAFLPFGVAYGAGLLVASLLISQRHGRNG